MPTELHHGDHERIYQVHHDFMDDIVYLPFLSSKQIDLPIIEYLESGEQINRTPRQWAKSLAHPDGSSLEVDMENGHPDGNVVLIIPSASLTLAKVELQKNWQRQNPMLMNAERFYTASILEDPNIPLTVFTKNIDKILAKKIAKKIAKKESSFPTAASVLSPDSSITGLTSKTSKSSIGWQVPLQSSFVKTSHCNLTAPQKETNKHPPSNISSREVEQLQRIAVLEAQLASMSAGNSRTSGDKSQLSGNSPNSLVTAHARLDGIETAVLNIHTLLKTMSSEQFKVATPPSSPTQSWPTMPRKPLFPEDLPGNQQLVLLPGGRSPAVSQKASKRRKALSSPSHLSPHHNETMDSGGESSF